MKHTTGSDSVQRLQPGRSATVPTQFRVLSGSFRDCSVAAQARCDHSMHSRRSVSRGQPMGLLSRCVQQTEASLHLHPDCCARETHLNVNFNSLKAHCSTIITFHMYIFTTSKHHNPTYEKQVFHYYRCLFQTQPFQGVSFFQCSS